MPAESTGQKTGSITTVSSTNIVFIGEGGATNGGLSVAAGGKVSGRLCAVLVTTALGAGAITIYDASTTTVGSSVIIGYLGPNTAIGTFQAYDISFSNGIMLSPGVNGSSVLTISYSVS